MMFVLSRRASRCESKRGRGILRFPVILALLLVPLHLASCVDHHHGSPQAPVDWQRDFTTFTHSDGRIAHEVLVRGEGPPVLLLHEIPGAMNETLALAMRLARDGFRVYLPILFGKPGDDAMVLNSIRSCVTGDFDCFSKEGSGAVVGWLRDLSRTIRDREGDPARGMAAIGMCLTGSIPIELAADPWIEGLVMSQPGLPLFGGEAALAVSPSSLECVRARALPVLYFRYSEDGISPQQRLDALESALPGLVRARVIDSSDGNPHGLDEGAHAVLSSGYVDRPGDPGMEAYATLVAFLEERIGVDENGSVRAPRDRSPGREACR
ncbi:MAG: dienelactone hydrolase family protein [Deltaproteobacteria bacterium]|nr:dienelactone hydrolase family protein [Deltaproteobacteria bacterium]